MTDVRHPARGLLYPFRGAGRAVLRQWFDLHQHGTHHALTKQEMFAGSGGLFLRATGQIPLERFRRGAAYLALVSGAPVVPVVMLGTRLPGEGSHAIPARGARIDIVYGEPWQLPAQPWPRRNADVSSANAALRTHMLHVLHQALASTGRSLPGPLPSGDSEAEPSPAVEPVEAPGATP